DDERDPNPLVEVVMGAVVHTGYSMRTAFRRARAEHAARRADEPEDFIHDREPSLDPREPSIAPEPVVTAAPQRRIHAPAAPFVEPSFEPTARIKEQPEYDDTAIDYPDIDQDDVPFVPETPVPARTMRGDSRFHPVDHAAPRAPVPVAAPAPRPAQGQRQFREAQGSLLDDNSGFELPALSLLAEPRHKGPSPEHAPERLEEMARQLEAVLQDFGVKGDIINVRP